MSVAMIESLLFSPFRLRAINFPNRIVIAPIQMYKAAPDGLATDWHFQHLATVDPIGRNTYGDLGIWSDEHVAPLRRIADFLKQQGVLAAAQLHHAGPKSSRQRPWEGLGPLGEAEAALGEPPWQPVSSTDSSSVAGWHRPRAMSVTEIDTLVAAYGASTRRAAEAGFDVIDIHAAHGYLIHSFLSPVANQRNDQYGGDLQGRTRLALEIAASVRANLPDGTPRFFRISCADWRKDLDTRTDGWTIEDSFVLAHELAVRGVDLIDCSSGPHRELDDGFQEDAHQAEARPSGALCRGDPAQGRHPDHGGRRDPGWARRSFRLGRPI
jgi:2,4-dienoyl-CoA reductase-like NADH-dependent reductase (Old Yellow Enzyme family)